MAALSSPLASALLAAVLAVAAGGCVRFQPVALYTGVDAPVATERPRDLALAVAPVIYDDQNDDTIWFMADARCTQGGLTEDVVYDGRRAISVSWDRATPGCAWAGLGFGWDNWAGKDISDVIPYAAVQMRVRTREGTMYGLPIVMTLEDYSGGMGFAYTGNRYFERPVIDEQWQTVTVPLAAFDLATENLDPTNVKQLMFELQQSGSLYIDDVRLVFYEAPVQEPWLVEAPRRDAAALPIELFDDYFTADGAWGLVTDACQSVRITDAEPGRGAALQLRWDARPEGCYRGEMGVSWDQWYPVDVTAIAAGAVIQLDVRLASGTAASVPVQIGLQDYSKRFSFVPLAARFGPSPMLTTEWQTLRIPFSALQGDADFRTVQQLLVRMTDTGEVFLDNIRLVAAD